MPDLLRLKLHERICENMRAFGILLLNDDTGSRMDTITTNHAPRSDSIVAITILKQWIQGKGVAVTWESLVKVLKDADLSNVAEQIQIQVICVKRSEILL